jgi:hypothetical protein
MLAFPFRFLVVIAFVVSTLKEIVVDDVADFS